MQLTGTNGPIELLIELLRTELSQLNYTLLTWIYVYSVSLVEEFSLVTMAEV